MSPIWTAVIIVIVTCCDALRDRWIKREVAWWPWHIVKWIAFYTPLVVLTILFIPLCVWPPLAVGCWVLWRIIYRYNGNT